MNVAAVALAAQACQHRLGDAGPGDRISHRKRSRG
jgi:hypothetical protein